MISCDPLLHVLIPKPKKNSYYKELLGLTFHFLRAANFLNFSIFTADAFLLSAWRVSFGCEKIKTTLWNAISFSEEAKKILPSTWAKERGKNNIIIYALNTNLNPWVLQAVLNCHSLPFKGEKEYFISFITFMVCISFKGLKKAYTYPYFYSHNNSVK